VPPRDESDDNDDDDDNEDDDDVMTDADAAKIRLQEGRRRRCLVGSSLHLD